MQPLFVLAKMLQTQKNIGKIANISLECLQTKCALGTNRKNLKGHQQDKRAHNNVATRAPRTNRKMCQRFFFFKKSLTRVNAKIEQQGL